MSSALLCANISSKLPSISYIIYDITSSMIPTWKSQDGSEVGLNTGLKGSRSICFLVFFDYTDCLEYLLKIYFPFCSCYLIKLVFRPTLLSQAFSDLSWHPSLELFAFAHDYTIKF